MLSVESNTYLAKVKKHLAKVADPLDRARVVNDEISAMTNVLHTLASFRAKAIREARQNMSAQEIADALGVRRQRVYQILGD
jgi:hypothetical protein